jgi:hypothetical protein
MKYILFLYALYVSLNAYAQDCTETSVMQKPGVWKEGMKGSVSGIPAADLDKERKVVASLQNLIKSKYTPIGVEADYNGSYDRPDTDTPVNMYDFKIYFMPYYCKNNIIKTADETSTTFFIASNRFDGNIYSIPDETTSSEGYYFLINKPVQKEGYFYFEEKASLGFGITGKSRNWLITLDGRLPYAYVTKKEFLEKQKQMLLKAMPAAIESSNESLKQIEQQKTQLKAEYKNDSGKFQRYLKNDYQYKKDRFEKNILTTEENYKNALTKLDLLLKMPSTESEKPAIVKQDPADNLSYLFTTDDDAFGKILIKPDPGYFNGKLSRSSPQFFLVNVTINEKDPLAAKVMTDLMKDFDFSALKNMLGK